ncbi:MAG: citrate synthase [Sandaracinaceae bacterium]|nr:citrate synthase [Sandaracinaceae bacterium]
MPNSASEYVTASAACALLDIKRASLYSYASRGFVRSVASVGGRARLYLRADIVRLRARHDARSGHTAVAASALRWGEPVLDSSITEIKSDGPHYRGHAAIALAQRHVSFERVVELLWGNSLPEKVSLFPDGVSREAARMLALLPKGAGTRDAFNYLLSGLAASDQDRFATSETFERARARRVIACAASLPALLAKRAAPSVAKSVAHRTAQAFGKRPTPRLVRALDSALVLVADHELSASAFAARVTASTGADLYACLLSAVSAFFGPLHGGECDRVEALLREIPGPDEALATVRARRARGESISGFSHRLYREGDPRTALLLTHAKSFGGTKRTQKIFALIRAVENTGGEAPTVDVGLVALAAALDLPEGSASYVFALGRMAGWVAHVFEQRSTNALLRPRARFVPVPTRVPSVSS